MSLAELVVVLFGFSLALTWEKVADWLDKLHMALLTLTASYASFLSAQTKAQNEYYAHCVKIVGRCLAYDPTIDGPQFALHTPSLVDIARGLPLEAVFAGVGGLVGVGVRQLLQMGKRSPSEEPVPASPPD
jgi:hypothetical protein